MPYSLQIKESASKELAQVQTQDRRRIVEAIDGLAENPLAGVPLKGTSRGLRRLRVGSHRVIYEVLNDALIVLVVRIGHLREFYRRR